MIYFKEAKTDSKEYKYNIDILTNSFPNDEYRDLKELKYYSNKKNNFTCNIIIKDENPIGIMHYWNFKDFIYIEHFAIEKKHRNKKMGTKVLQKFIQEAKKNIVLEVEPPEDKMSKKRIEFYSRLGFNLHHKKYIQPPYKSNSISLDMKLMTYGDIDIDEKFNKIVNTLYLEVYNQEIDTIPILEQHL